MPFASQLRRFFSQVLIAAMAALAAAAPQTSSDNKCPDGSTKDPVLGCRDSTRDHARKAAYHHDRKAGTANAKNSKSSKKGTASASTKDKASDQKSAK